ncbi:MAG TPA: BatD family protein, partial [Polyangiaceae bacterium]|nr:BatD family protein [Polyangiaceae bacterium]
MIQRILLCLIALGVLVPRPALAQPKPQILVQVDADTVGVGDVVHVTMSATSSDTMPTDPQIGATPGFIERGRNPSPSETHFNINGSQTDRYTLTVDFILQAKRVGTFTVGPPSVAVRGARLPSQPVTLHVVPAGKAPPRRLHPAPQPTPFGFSFSPFDPWKGLFPGLDGNGREPASPPTVTT